jgi:peroxiredoxin
MRNAEGFLLRAAVVALAATTVVLARQNHALKLESFETYERATTPHTGLLLPAFAARTLAGEATMLGETPRDGRQVLFFFNSKCPYCRASVPAWKQVLAAGGFPAAAAYGVSLDDEPVARSYARQQALPFPVVSMPGRRFAIAWRIHEVPRILVVDSEGRIVYSRAGVLQGQAAVDSVVAAARGAPVRTASAGAR